MTFAGKCLNFASTEHIEHCSLKTTFKIALYTYVLEWIPFFFTSVHFFLTVSLRYSWHTKLYILNVNNFASFDKLTNVYTHETVTTVKVVNISITSKSLFMTLCNCSLPSLSAFPSSLSNQGSTFCHC